MQVWINKKKFSNDFLWFFFVLYSRSNLNLLPAENMIKYSDTWRNIISYASRMSCSTSVHLLTYSSIYLFPDCVCVYVLLQACEYEWVKICCCHYLAVEKGGRKKILSNFLFEKLERLLMPFFGDTSVDAISVEWWSKIVVIEWLSGWVENDSHIPTYCRLLTAWMNDSYLTFSIRIIPKFNTKRITAQNCPQSVRFILKILNLNFEKMKTFSSI